MTLRAACIHGRYEGHKVSFIPSEPPTYNRGGARKGQNVMCPGGREVTIDYEAAIDVWERYERADEIDDQYRTPADFVREAVAAAIGDTE